jgi:hypothetical protein
MNLISIKDLDELILEAIECNGSIYSIVKDFPVSILLNRCRVLEIDPIDLVRIIKKP